MKNIVIAPITNLVQILQITINAQTDVVWK